MAKWYSSSTDKTIEISEMVDQYLMNTLNYLKRGNRSLNTLEVLEALFAEADKRTLENFILTEEEKQTILENHKR